MQQYITDCPRHNRDSDKERNPGKPGDINGNDRCSDGNCPDSNWNYDYSDRNCDDSDRNYGGSDRNYGSPDRVSGGAHEILGGVDRLADRANWICDDIELLTLGTFQLFIHVFDVWSREVLKRKALILFREFQLLFRLIDSQTIGNSLLHSRS